VNHPFTLFGVKFCVLFVDQFRAVTRPFNGLDQLGQLGLVFVKQNRGFFRRIIHVRLLNTGHFFQGTLNDIGAGGAVHSEERQCDFFLRGR